MKNVWYAIKNFLTKNHELVISIDYFYIFSIAVNQFAFSILMNQKGFAMFGFFWYYESVDNRNKYVIQIAWKEIIINGRKAR